ncbi:hypothetical protein EMIHUDRAFT_252527 [Emiliania huxleyi CCMP1516]|uniref:Chromo domain-containing protein n=2 Tax=Emiliania huxleyi TaxID=2903 RepID=A0A0D3KJ79_EMIH1|nr:hypothetical protein EMIHUDRAFT_252527 [Emiliania huxleyi CCMP1516]EOD35814.1 hypothetical protein EMIHUDRAFT_252527 [Emiliania huxleyi CCMP1516]|eukprot:XP_005788243.1 hypothetical protein EMIHUDRAFT_252527 [Emiliania huxleyi CCMP1516]
MDTLWGPRAGPEIAGPITSQRAKNRYLTESNQTRRRSGRGRKRLLLPESYNVEKVVSWRQRAGGIELLTAWEDYDVDGWTWEPLDNIPKRFVRAFHAQRERLPQSFFYVVTKMRDRVAFKLLERTGPMFGVAVLAKIAVKEDHWQRAHTLTITSQEHAAWIVSLHESRPTHGVGALRIKSARRLSNMLLVACNARTPMRLSFVEPRAGGSDAPAPGSYKFTVEFTTVGINSATGDIMPYTAPTEELRLEMAEAHALVAYSKKTLKQPWAAEPVRHSLRASGWCDQPVAFQ